jgi:hypothetical protein
VHEITHKPVFWIAFAALSALCGALAWRYFPDALPLINLDVKMSRSAALAQGVALAERLKLAPPDARAAAMFGHDGDTQNFVELEAGGNARFSALLSGNLYSPYWWDVRLFKPRETAEARVRFRPDGTPYGFARQVPETQPGAALAADAARAIAETRAREDWDIDFTPFKLLEHSQQQRPNGRVDHVFVYERESETLGDGRFRMSLGVTGDEFTGLLHFVHVPEAFERRFAEMRAANNAIARVASLCALLLYGIGGCVLGALWLLRKHALIWRPALVAGVIVAGLNALAIVANAPQAWFNVDTAQPEWVFWGLQAGVAMLVLLGGGLALALVFMAAESLSRLAFPEHPQFWRLWSRDAAPTSAVLGRTLGGYLFVPIELALIVAFYFITNRYFGWWQPSESLSDPNILGSALPSLAPIGMALQAGFMEESLFRAVPLSLAALIGARFGHRGVAIGATLVLQAVIFGAAHANYPGFPAYSRLVELIGPALIWGLIFLRFGLLPTVILHALFDLVLMSLPIFLIDGPSATANQALVIAAGLVPLAVVLVRRARIGAWLTLSANLRNAAWLRGHHVEMPAAGMGSAAAGIWAARMQRALPALAIAGALIFTLGSDFRSNAPPLVIDRAQAETVAQGVLKERGIVLGPEWKRMSATRFAMQDGNSWLWQKFVWREAGRDIYSQLMGTWLAPPLWDVRYARFDVGDVADRAEEWRVTVDGTGRVRQIRHSLPEARPGAKLSQEDARKLAQQEISRRFGLDPAAMREVSAEQQERPARIDWQFTYTDPRVDVGKGGEARVLVGIAGDEVSSAGRYIFVPEDWQRAERERASRLRVAKVGIGILVLIVGVAALIAAIVAWSRGHFDRRAFWLTNLCVGVALAFGGLNQWPAAAMSLATTEPYTWQILLWLGGTAVSLLLFTLLIGLIAGVAAWAARAQAYPRVGVKALYLRGAAAGLFVAGINALVGGMGTRDTPHWPRPGDENAWLPLLAALAGPFPAVFGGMAVTTIMLYWLDRFTHGWQRHRVLTFVVLAFAAGAQAALSADDWVGIIAAGVAVGALNTVLFATVIRFDLRIIPAFVAAQVGASIVTAALLQRTTAGNVFAALSLATTLLITWAATRYLVSAGTAQAPERPVAPSAT